MTYDVFISHASEDKATVAKPLADLLVRRGWRVWLDSFELTVGDSLRERIDEGLTHSRFGVVVLSKAFLTKDWPQRELNALYTKATQGRKVLLPVWHRLERSDVAAYSALLADCLAAKTDVGLEAVAEELIRAMGAPQACNDDVATRNSSLAMTHLRNDPQSTGKAKRLQGGGVLGDDNVYVERGVDREVLNHVKSKSFGMMSIRAPRMMGKSSLLARLCRALSEERSVVRLDMCGIGGGAPQGWFGDFALSLTSHLDVTIDEDITPASVERMVANHVRRPTLITIDEADALPDGTLERVMSLMRSLTRRDLPRGGAITCVVSFEPSRESLVKSIVAPDDEIGYHVRLPPLSLTETSRLFQLGDIDISTEQAIEVHRLTGGAPWLVQRFAIGIERGEAIQQIADAILSGGDIFCYEMDRRLGGLATDWKLIDRVERGKNLPEASVRTLRDLEMITRTSEGWRLAGGLVQRYCVDRLRSELWLRRWLDFIFRR